MFQVLNIVSGMFRYRKVKKKYKWWVMCILVTVSTSELNSFVDTLIWRVWHIDVWKTLEFRFDRVTKGARIELKVHKIPLL